MKAQDFFTVRPYVTSELGLYTEVSQITLSLFQPAPQLTVLPQKQTKTFLVP
jgi:hypothetical protein